VKADARQIGRILDNLINNSLTYAARSPRLKLNAVVERDRAIVRIIDNGVGMSNLERPRVFQPFHRTNDPAFSGVPGAGLGLYSSRKLAEANQGRLTLERSQTGVGSCFALDLPLTSSKPPRALGVNDVPSDRFQGPARRT
jgi:signal transduction histidine kinase